MTEEMLNRIDELTKEKKWSRRNLERQSGLAVGTITKWKSVNPSHDKLKKVADALDVSVAYLTGESDFRSEQDAIIHKWTQEQKEGLADEVRRIEAGIRIPVLGEIPHDKPIEYADESSEWEEISEKLARTGTFYGLKVKGDSMSPRIIEGDILIIKQQNSFASGDIVIVQLLDKSVCRKIIKQNDGVVLQCLNPSFESMYFSNDELNRKIIQIVGKVVENRQKY